MKAEQLIEDEEGFCPYAYSDSKGYLTIGIGTLVDQRGGGITLDEARYLMVNRVRPIYSSLDECMSWWRSLNEARQAVLVSMAYQMGISGLLKFKRTLEAMKRGDYKSAADGMLASKWAREDSPSRARRAARAMRTGSFATREDA